MRLFAADLYRNFGIGFVLGAVLVVGANASSWGAAVASPAQAAELPQASARAPAISDEFVIAPPQG